MTESRKTKPSRKLVEESMHSYSTMSGCTEVSKADREDNLCGMKIG